MVSSFWMPVNQAPFEEANPRGGERIGCDLICDADEVDIPVGEL